MTDNKLINHILETDLGVTKWSGKISYGLILWKSGFVDGVKVVNVVNDSNGMKYVNIKYVKMVFQYDKNNSFVYNIRLMVDTDSKILQYKYKLNGDELIVSEYFFTNDWECKTIVKFINDIDYIIIPKLEMLNAIFDNAFMTNMLDDIDGGDDPLFKAKKREDIKHGNVYGKTYYDK